jgi:hypothetical protein
MDILREWELKEGDLFALLIDAVGKKDRVGARMAVDSNQELSISGRHRLRTSQIKYLVAYLANPQHDAIDAKLQEHI